MNPAKTIAIALVVVGSSTLYAAVDQVSNWNTVAVQATLTAGGNAIVQSRALAIVNVAIHDALNSIDPRYERYAFKGEVQAGASVDAAIAAAARDTLVGAIAVGTIAVSPIRNAGTAGRSGGAGEYRVCHGSGGHSR